MALSDNLIGLWSPWLGSSGYRILDRSSYRNDATLNNMDAGTDWIGATVRGRSGFALDFDGSNDFASTASLPSRVRTSTISLSGWFWAPSGTYTTSNYICSVPHSTASNGIDFRNAQAVRLVCADGTGNLSDVISTVDIRNTWTHLAGVWNGQRAILYANGVEVASNAYTSGVSTALNRLAIGSFRPDTFSLGSACRCAEVQLHFRALAPSEVLELSRISPGWYQPCRQRRYAFVGGAAGFRAYWARRQSQLIGGGV